MKLLTKDIERRLLANGAKTAKDHIGDNVPVVKFFNPIGAATWLISEADPEEPDILFGLCDLGLGFPEMGNVRLSELEGVRLRGGLKIERDRWFKGEHPLTWYWERARAVGRIEA